MQIWLSALAISFITATLKKDFDSALLDDKLWVSQKKKDKENQDTLYTAAQLKAYFRRSIISFLTVIQSLIFVDSGSINCEMMAKFQRTKCLVIPFVSVLEWSKILQFLRLALYRSSRPGVFCKKGAVKNFTKFTVKHPCQSLFFNKVSGFRPATLLKKRPWHRCFTVNFVEFLRTPFFIERLWWLLLSLSWNFMEVSLEDSSQLIQFLSKMIQH